VVKHAVFGQIVSVGAAGVKYRNGYSLSILGDWPGANLVDPDPLGTAVDSQLAKSGRCNTLGTATFFQFLPESKAMLKFRFDIRVTCRGIALAFAFDRETQFPQNEIGLARRFTTTELFGLKDAAD